jgi:hypothetical protein
MVSAYFSLWHPLFLMHFAGREMSPHVVDVATMRGLLDFITVGCLIELSPAVEYKPYPKSPEEQDEIEAVATRFRMFVRWFGDSYCLLAGSMWINGNYIFRRRLVDFAATICLYTQEHQEERRAANLSYHGPSPGLFRKLVTSHFAESWPELVAPFQLAVENASRRLYYDGPEFLVVPLTKEALIELRSLGYTEELDFSLNPLTTVRADPSLPQPPKTPPSKRDHPSAASSPNKSPSSSRPTKRPC